MGMRPLSPGTGARSEAGRVDELGLKRGQAMIVVMLWGCRVSCLPPCRGLSLCRARTCRGWSVAVPRSSRAFIRRRGVSEPAPLPFWFVIPGLWCWASAGAWQCHGRPQAALGAGLPVTSLRGVAIRHAANAMDGTWAPRPLPPRLPMLVGATDPAEDARVALPRSPAFGFAVASCGPRHLPGGIDLLNG